MKKNVTITMNLAAVLFLILSVFSSCTKEYITEEYITKEYTTVGSTVKTHLCPQKSASDWKWNDRLKCYESKFTLSDLDENLYEHGTLVGSVFISGFDYETQRTLPFVQAYDTVIVDGKIFPEYTEMISMDYSKQPKQVTFYLQSSDLKKETPYLRKMTFRVSLIWDSENGKKK